MVQASSHANVSRDGGAGDWYWELISRERVIERGLAATEALARADTMRAMLSKGDPRGENLPPCREDQSPPYAPLVQVRAATLADTGVQRHGDNHLLAALPPDTLALLAGELRQVSLQQGAILLEPGDEIADIYFPLSGLVSLLVLGRNGEAIETFTVGREGAVGLQSALGGRRSFTQAITQIGGRFSTIKAARFEQIAGGSAAVRDLIQRYTEVLLAKAQQIAACNAMHSGPARLCRWLLQCADNAGRDELPVTQEFLARMLGLRRTTVTLLAQSMQARGLIKYGRGRIVLLDRKFLEQCACECYDIMRHEKLAPALGVHI